MSSVQKGTTDEHFIERRRTAIVDRYLEKYKITNKSRWLRETILMFIHKNMEEDYPTLFGEHDMRR